MTYTLIPKLWYTITPETDCDIDTPNGISIHLPAGIQYFHFADSVSIDISGTATITQNPPLFKPAPALGGKGAGGYIESDLNVGHGAADAVAAVCTLTLGDLTQGGTLTDGTTTLELDGPDETAEGSTKAEGWLPIVDATAAGSVTFGEHEPVVFDEAAGERAAGWIQVGAGGGDWLINGEPFPCPSPYDSVQAWNEALRGFGLFCTDETIEVGSPKVNIAAIVPGEAGNDITLESTDPDNWPVSGPTLTGGSDGTRTAADIAAAFEALDYISEAVVDADEGGITLTAAHAGVNDVISVEGDLFGSARPPIGMAGGVLSYTLAEIVSAINAETDFGVTAAATETEGAITLTSTATEHQADANGIIYTATGCFGSGTTRQGSTTRGRNAVEQTDYKIYLNGDELDMGPAPVPEPLTHDTQMRHGHVYTVAAGETPLDFSDVTIVPNATAEIRIDCSVTASIVWPAGWKWMPEEGGGAPPLRFARNYVVEVRENGGDVLARVVAEFTPGLPAGFEGLDYVTMDKGGYAGAGFIQTGINVARGDVWYNEVEHLQDAASGGWGNLFDVNLTSSAGVGPIAVDGVNVLKAALGDTVVDIGPLADFMGARHSLKITVPSTVEVDGAAVISRVGEYTSPWSKRWYAAGAVRGAASTVNRSRIYGGYIKRGSETLAKWVPCKRVSDGAYCLYDLVAGGVMTVSNWILTHE